MTNPAPFAPRRILALQLRQIGDVLLATPALEALKLRFPDAELHLVTEQKCAELLLGNPSVDQVLALDKKELTPFSRELGWYWRTAHGRYDLVVDFQQLPRCRWLVAFSGAPVRLGVNPRWYSRPLYTHAGPAVPGYAAWTKVSGLAPLGIPAHNVPPRLYLSRAETDEMRARLAGLGVEAGRLITLDTTHRRLTRRWPAAHYAELIALLHRADATLRFMPLWGPGEERDIRDLLALLPEHLRASVALPNWEPSLRRTAACIGEAALHIGHCSAPRHMAVALGTPTCVIPGSSGPEWRYPSEEHIDVTLNLPCQPCGRDACPHCDCLTGLAPAVVAEAALGLLGRARQAGNASTVSNHN